MSASAVIVIGVGGMGAAACYHLARRGCRVRGLEAFDLGHDRGSSHGETRICRKAYFEHPDYVPLLHRVYALWEELEQTTGERLFHRCGLLLAGDAEGELIRGVTQAANLHGLEIETVAPNAAPRRFPGFRLHSHLTTLFEPDAGFLRVEACVAAHVRAAQSLGATIQTHERVRRWTADDRGVRVTTDRGTYDADALVITSGAWAGELLAELALPITIQRRVQMWFNTSNSQHHLDRGCPVFGFEVDGGFFYGFPSCDGRCMKIAEHSGDDPVAGADDLDRGLRAADSRRVQAFASKWLPGVRPPPVRHEACMYAMTPDGQFVIDRHPRYPQVAFAAGFSGHGFKFAPLVGSILADLVLDGATAEPIEFLSLRRFGSGDTPN